jgi:hypothetical protein
MEPINENFHHKDVFVLNSLNCFMKWIFGLMYHGSPRNTINSLNKKHMEVALPLFGQLRFHSSLRNKFKFKAHFEVHINDFWLC